MQWKTLLVPHDFSPAAARALGVANELAAMCGAKVNILHVSPIPHGIRADSKIVPDETSEPVRIDEYMTNAARMRLEGLLSEQGATAALHVVAAEDDPAAVILDQAKAIGADVIVMGTHGRTGMARLMMGSVAERVLRRAHVPVLVVRDPGGAGAALREEDAVRDEEDG